MIVQHNMEAAVANRHLGFNTTNLGKSTEKLASGYKINRAADNAAGLAITEKMRAQIRGLDQGAANCTDGISFCNVADGAMQELEDIIHRARELCVEAANDTYVTEDRIAIQEEIELLTEEVDRITEETEFNTIKVFRPNMKVTQYEEELSTGKWVKVKEVVTTLEHNKWGITEVLGEENVYDGSNLTYPLEFSGSGWHTSGKDHVYTSIYEADGKSKTTSTSWSDLSAQLTSKYGISIPEHSSERTATYTSADGCTDITVDYSEYDNTGERVVTSIDIEEYDKPASDPDRSVLPVSTTSVSSNSGGNGDNGGSSSGKFGAAWLDFKKMGTEIAMESLDGEGFNSTCWAGCKKHYSIKFLAKEDSAAEATQSTSDGVKYAYKSSTSNPCLLIDISGCKNGEDIVKAVMSVTTDPRVSEFTNHYSQYAYSEEDPTKLYVYNNYGMGGREGSTDGRWEPVARDDEHKIEFIIEKEVWMADKKSWIEYSISEFNIQAGANAKQMIEIEKPWLTAENMGMLDLSVISHEEEEPDSQLATRSIAVCDSALTVLNKKRSYIGAMTNRLEYAYDNNLNNSENTQAAESKMRDLDMANEMVQYAKNSILMQAGQSMLANANQSKEGVLTLLQ